MVFRHGWVCFRVSEAANLANLWTLLPVFLPSSYPPRHSLPPFLYYSCLSFISPPPSTPASLPLFLSLLLILFQALFHLLIILLLIVLLSPFFPSSAFPPPFSLSVPYHHPAFTAPASPHRPTPSTPPLPPFLPTPAHLSTPPPPPVPLRHPGRSRHSDRTIIFCTFTPV